MSNTPSTESLLRHAEYLRRPGKSDLLFSYGTAAMLEGAAVEIERLRAAIKGAPHHDDCHDGGWGLNPCDCWKADAL